MNEPRRLTRVQSRAATRDRLRAAAANQFACRGVGGVSIDTISEAAGFSRGAFYANYATKTELLLDLLAEKHKAEIAVWGALIAEADNIDALLKILADRFDSFSQGHELLDVELRLEARRNEAVAAASAASRHEIRIACRALVEALAAKARVTVDADSVGLLLQAVTSGVALQIPDPGQASRGRLIVDFLSAVLGIGRASDGRDSRIRPRSART
ncbi:MAG: TetR/AcrR family transcriptional regulator [Janthinobacterium lividum]